jgi:tetratricopeptide (TPR) repeat protein
MHAHRSLSAERRRGAALAALLAPLALLARAALAQPPPDVAQAQVLLQQGQALGEEGRCAEAIPLFEQSLALHRGLGTRFHLAECYERTGKLEAAAALFVEVADEARAQGKAKLEGDARGGAARVDARMPKLTVVVPGWAQRLGPIDLRLDGAPLAPEALGKPLRVAAGEHVVTARAAGKKPFAARKTLAEGESALLPLGPFEDEIAPPVEPTRAPPREPAPLPPVQGGRSPYFIVMTGFGVGGILGVGGGIGAGIAALNKNAAWKQETKAHCDAKLDCDSQGSIDRIHAIERDRSAFGAASTVGFVAGGATLAVALSMWLATPKAAPAQRLGLRVAPVPGGAVVTGSF